MTNKTTATIEEAAKAKGIVMTKETLVFTAGAKEVIEHPEQQDLTPTKMKEPMEIELIEDFGLKSLQDKISEFTANKDIVSVSVSVSPMCDFYENRPQEVCNQWHQYVAAIIYKS